MTSPTDLRLPPEYAVATLVEKRAIFVVRGEPIEVSYRVRRMPDGEEFRIVGVDGPDPFELAYAEYRRRHGLPETADLRTVVDDED